MKKWVAGALMASLVTAGIVGATSASASGTTLPQQKSAANQSLATAKVLGSTAEPQAFAARSARFAPNITTQGFTSLDDLTYVPVSGGTPPGVPGGPGSGDAQFDSTH